MTPTLRKSPQIDVFTELDPLGTGLIKPYVDKKDFFQHLKNPPKKVLKDLVTTTSGDTFPANFNLSCDPLEPVPVQMAPLASISDGFEDDNFADFNKFDGIDIPAVKSDSPRTRRVSSPRVLHHQPLSVSLPPEEAPMNKTKADKDLTESVQSLVRLPSPKKYMQSVRKKEFDIDLAASGRAQSMDRPFPVDFTSNNDSPASPLRSCSSDANSRLSSSSTEMDIVPEPPPRGAGSILINPPPLPPKKQGGRSVIKPPPRPPHSDGHFHYDFIERAEASPSPTRKDVRKSPAKDFRNRFDDDFSPPPPQVPKRSELVATFPVLKFEDAFTSLTPTTISSLLQNNSSTTSSAEARKAKPSLDITLSQLTSTNLGDLANTLGMSISELTSLTLQQLTECLATLTANENERCNGGRDREPEIPAKPNAKSIVETSTVYNEPLFKADFDQGMKQTEENSYDKYAVFRELLELEQQKHEYQEDVEKDEEPQVEAENRESEPEEPEVEEERKESPDTVEIEIVEAKFPMGNLTVNLPPIDKDSSKTEPEFDYVEEVTNASPESVQEDEKTDSQESKGDDEDIVEPERLKDAESEVEDVANNKLDEDTEMEMKVGENEMEIEMEMEKTDEPEQKEDAKNDDKPKVKSTTVSSNDRYAALREIIGETVENCENDGEDDKTTCSSPPAPKPPLASIDLMSLFSKSLQTSVSSPKKSLSRNKEEEVKVAVMDIFEEIKMLNNETARKGGQDTVVKSAPASGFEDTFSPFPLAEPKIEKDEAKDDPSWAKFDSTVFHSDKSSGEGPASVGGTSPWSPDGKEFHDKVSPPFKPTPNRNSGDSDNEWKDEEESEGSNGRPRDDGFWGPGGKPPPRHQTDFEESRSYYDHGSPTGPPDKDRSFRDRAGRKARGSPWGKTGHRSSRDPSPWHEDGRWEEDHRGPRYSSRKMPYKEEEEPYNSTTHWKCRPKQTKQRPWSGEREGFWSHDHPSYDEERKRRMMLWNEAERDRFSSQESMAYEDDERWARRWSNEYERRRCREEEGRFWGRRGPETDYPYREPRESRDPREPYRIHEPHYCRDNRERSHDYPPPGWEEEYAVEHGDESPRYSSRKRPWPKRPNSATESRNAEVVYGDPRQKYTVSRSECSDNDSDPYHRPHRSRSRESYWGSDQEFEREREKFDGWVERPCWSESGPEANATKSETLHRRRMNRHKARSQTKSQGSPFEDDFTQSLENVEPSADPFVPGTESRLATETEPKLTDPVTLSPRGTKEALRREPRSYKRSYRHSPFEEDLTPTASVSSDTSDRQRLGSDLKATPEELPRDTKDAISVDGFVSEDSGRDSFFNGDPRFDDDAFTFKSELEDSVPERATTLPLKNSRQYKCGGGGKIKSDQYIKKSESVNIFVRESDPFDDDDFFN